MKIRVRLLALASCATLAACSADDDMNDGAGESELQLVRAALQDAEGSTRGEAIIARGSDGLLLTVRAENMKPGSYGVHVHEVGKCDAPDFASAGGHWNPMKNEHGLENPRGFHKGDLPNLVVGDDGKGNLEQIIASAELSDGNRALMDADGAAFMIHAGPDDMKSDPSGNSGARIACGVFGP